MGKSGYDVAVVGSGPAGLTASVYTARGAASTVVFGGSAWGGQLMLTTAVDNFPGFPEGIQGPELMERMKKQAERFGAKFLSVDVDRVDLSKTPFGISANGLDYQVKSIIVATGASVLWLDAPGVRELIGRGVSSCAPCDAPFFKDKKVAVVGGGDTAMEEALVLTKYSSEVTIIHRRDKFRASSAMQEKVLGNPKIKILWNTEVQKVGGQDKVNSLIIKNNQIGEVLELAVDGIFIAIGHKPQSELFAGQLDIDEKGFIKIVEPHSKTSKAGVFVAGDVADPYYKQAVTAAGSGCAAALDALKFLEENDSHV